MNLSEQSYTDIIIFLSLGIGFSIIIAICLKFDLYSKCCTKRATVVPVVTPLIKTDKITTDDV